MQLTPDGYCRGYQLIRRLPDGGWDDEDESEQRVKELSAARQLNETNTGGTLDEAEVAAMVKQLRPSTRNAGGAGRHHRRST